MIVCELPALHIFSRTWFRVLMCMAIFFAIGSSAPVSIQAASTEDGVIVNVTSDTCNNNGICEPNLGETYFCSLDACPAATSTDPDPEPEPEPEPPGTHDPSFPAEQSDSGFIWTSFFDDLFFGSDNQTDDEYDVGSFPLITFYKITPGSTDIRLIIITSQNALTRVRWGETSAFDGGTITGVVPSLYHEHYIDHLTPDTQYSLYLTSINKQGVEIGRQPLTVRTLPIDMTPVRSETVRYFNGLYDQKTDRVSLQWIIAESGKSDYVRLVRRYDRLPRHALDGTLLYQGRETEFIDVLAEKPADTPEAFYAVYNRFDGTYSAPAYKTVLIGAINAEDQLCHAPLEDVLRGRQGARGSTGKPLYGYPVSMLILLLLPVVTLLARLVRSFKMWG